jgi:hypothetical protein
MRHTEPVELAATWLSDTVRRGPDRVDPVRAALLGLFGTWLAARSGAAEEPVDDLAGRVGSLVADDAFDPTAYDPRLLFLCQQVLRERGGEPRVLGAYAAARAGTLRAMEKVPARYAAEVRLLTALGEAPLGDTGRLEHAVPVPAVPLLRLPTRELGRLCGVLAGTTGYGAVPPTGPLAPALRRAVPVLLLARLRRHDLALGTALLRALRYLRCADCVEAHWATEYLLCQQRPDGAFGDGVPAVDLAVTVSALWSLVEVASPGFHLVQGGGRPAPVPGPAPRRPH